MQHSAAYADTAAGVLRTSCAALLPALAPVAVSTAAMTAAATSAGHSAETDRLQTIQTQRNRTANIVSVQLTGVGIIRHLTRVALQSTQCGYQLLMRECLTFQRLTQLVGCARLQQQATIQHYALDVMVICFMRHRVSQAHLSVLKVISMLKPGSVGACAAFITMWLVSHCSQQHTGRHTHKCHSICSIQQRCLRDDLLNRPHRQPLPN
jgi:hypothetical protein